MLRRNRVLKNFRWDAYGTRQAAGRKMRQWRVKPAAFGADCSNGHRSVGPVINRPLTRFPDHLDFKAAFTQGLKQCRFPQLEPWETVRARLQDSLRLPIAAIEFPMLGIWLTSSSVASSRAVPMCLSTRPRDLG
jgi:hypothetical protein